MVRRIGGRTKEQYVADMVEQSIADRTRRAAEAREGGPGQYVHVTTKSAKREDVYGIKAAA